MYYINKPKSCKNPHNTDKIYCSYKIENRLLKKEYIGICYSSIHPFDRKYLSSSVSEDFKDDYLDHPEWFFFRITNYFRTLKEVSDFECNKVSKEYVKRGDTYNIFPATSVSKVISFKDMNPYLKISNIIKLSKGIDTSYQSMVKSRERNNKRKKSLGIPTTQEKGAKTRIKNDNVKRKKGLSTSRDVQSRSLKTNQRIKKSKGEKTCWDKISDSKLQNLYDKYEGLKTKLKVTNSSGIDVFEGDMIEVATYLWTSKYRFQYRNRLFRLLKSKQPIKSGPNKGRIISIVELISPETIPVGSTTEWLEISASTNK